MSTQVHDVAHESPYEGDAGAMQERTLDLRRLLHFFRRRLRLLLGVGAVVFIVLLLASLLIPPSFTGVAEVASNRAADQVVDVKQVVNSTAPDSAQVDTEVEVLSSPQLHQKVIDKLNLTQVPEFNAELAPAGPFDWLIKPIKGLFATPMTPATHAQAVRMQVLTKFEKQLKIKRTGLTYAIDVTFSSQSPSLAAQVPNVLVNQYLADQLSAKTGANTQANSWIASRLDGLRQQAQQADAEVQAFKAQHGLLAATQGDTSTGLEISTLKTQLASARADAAEQEAKLAAARTQIARGGAGQDVAPALDSPVIAQLRTQRAEISKQVADMQGRYGPRHPDLLKAQRQLADIDGQIQGEVQRIVSNVQAQASVARQRAASLQGSISSAQGQLASNGEAQVRLNELTRNADSVHELYQAFLNRYKQTGESQGLQQADSRLVAAAVIPLKPSFPRPILVLAVAIVLASGAALATGLAAEMLDSSLSTALDVEHMLGVSSLGVIPALGSTLRAKDRGARGAPANFVVDKPLSAFAEAFRSLRTAIVYGAPGREVRVVAMTSALPGEGKTTSALCLARTVAGGGGKVVVVDCDVRHPSLAAQTGKIGLMEVLDGRAPLEQALRKDERTSAMLLPLSDARYAPNDLFASEAMDRLLTDLRARFDLVILDTAPVLPVAETRILAKKADATVLLVRWRKTPSAAVRAALKMLDQVGVQVEGVALTQVNLREQSRTGYGDASFFYPAFRSYYS